TLRTEIQPDPGSSRSRWWRRRGGIVEPAAEGYHQRHVQADSRKGQDGFQGIRGQPEIAGARSGPVAGASAGVDRPYAAARSAGSKFAFCQTGGLPEGSGRRDGAGGLRLGEQKPLEALPPEQKSLQQL